jgi:hypothetical protein
MGSPAIASLIAHFAFWGLLWHGWMRDEIGVKGIVLFLMLWVTGLYGLPYIPYGEAMFSSFVAVLDIVLVFLIFKGDVRLR